MIDELAKAFCCKSYCQKRIGGQQCFAPCYKDGVENLLRRLREPTHQMLAKGALALCEEREAQTKRSAHSGAADLANASFRAMIDAALGEKA